MSRHHKKDQTTTSSSSHHPRGCSPKATTKMSKKSKASANGAGRAACFIFGAMMILVALRLRGGGGTGDHPKDALPAVEIKREPSQLGRDLRGYYYGSSPSGGKNYGYGGRGYGTYGFGKSVDTYYNKRGPSNYYYSKDDNYKRSPSNYYYNKDNKRSPSNYYYSNKDKYGRSPYGSGGRYYGYSKSKTSRSSGRRYYSPSYYNYRRQPSKPSYEKYASYPSPSRPKPSYDKYAAAPPYMVDSPVYKTTVYKPTPPKPVPPPPPYEPVVYEVMPPKKKPEEPVVYKNPPPKKIDYDYDYGPPKQLTAKIGRYPGFDYAGNYVDPPEGYVTVKFRHTYGYDDRVVGVDMDIEMDVINVHPSCSSTTNTKPNGCGVHIHEGMTCSDADRVGGHYWNKDELGDADPWGKVRYDSSSDSTSTTQLHLPGGNHYDYGRNVRRVVVIHDWEGKRIGCGVLLPKRVEYDDYDYGPPKKLTATIGRYPGFDYTGYVDPPRGYVTVKFRHTYDYDDRVVGVDMDIEMDVINVHPSCSSTTNMEPNGCGVHIHEGTTCSDADRVGGHYWNKVELGEDNDPWKRVRYDSSVDSTSTTQLHLPGGNFYDYDMNVGHVVVIHDWVGKRIGCGVLLPVEKDVYHEEPADPTYPMDKNPYNRYCGPNNESARKCGYACPSGDSDCPYGQKCFDNVECLYDDYHVKPEPPVYEEEPPPPVDYDGDGVIKLPRPVLEYPEDPVTEYPADTEYPGEPYEPPPPIEGRDYDHTDVDGGDGVYPPNNKNPPPVVDNYYPDDGGGNNYCGVNYAMAAATCSNPCPSGLDSECSEYPGGNNQKCFGGVHCLGPVGARWCGSSFKTASEYCDRPCPGGTNDECPPYQMCFGHVDRCYEPPHPPPGGEPSYRCGMDWADAMSCQYPSCPNGVDSECPPGLRCQADIHCGDDERPKPGGDNHCGKTYETVTKCGDPCPSGKDEQCPYGEKCFGDVSKPCPDKPPPPPPPTYKYIDDKYACSATREPTYDDYHRIEEIIHDAIRRSTCPSAQKCGCFGREDGPYPLAARLVRLAFHDSNGHVDGYVNLHDQVNNAGLGCAIDILTHLYEKEVLSGDWRIVCVLSKADFFVWSYLAAVRHGAMVQKDDGHRYLLEIKITWGRITYHPTDPSDVGPHEVQPHLNTLSYGHLLEKYFSEHYGFSKRQVVIIMGAHTMGLARMENSLHRAPWTQNPHVFNEEFYTNIQRFHWRQIRVSDTTFQWSVCDDDADRAAGDAGAGGGGGGGNRERGCFGLMLNVDIAIYHDIDDWICTGPDTSRATYPNSDKPCIVGEVVGYPEDSPCKWGMQPPYARCFPLRVDMSDDVAFYAKVENRVQWMDEFAEVYHLMLTYDKRQSPGTKIWVLEDNHPGLTAAEATAAAMTAAAP